MRIRKLTVAKKPFLRRALGAGAVLLAAVAAVSPAAAHTSERAFVLLLPTGLYMTGGVVVVAVSFLLVALIPVANVRAIAGLGWPIGKIPAVPERAISLTMLLIMAALVLAGHYGTQDPLANPLALAVWTLWWLGLTAAHALFGDLWSVMNPWRGLVDALYRIGGAGRRVARPPLAYPDWLGYWPAVASFLAFAWFELVFAAPRNPEILADAVAFYFLANLIGTLLFGTAHWLRYGETFSVFFRIVAWLSPLNGRPEAGRIVVTVPGLGLLHVRPLPPSGAAFVLLSLSSVSFDGLSRTYWWLARIGVNPLEFPGRSALAWANTLGLLGLFALLTTCYLLAVWLGHRLAGRPGRLSDAVGRQVIAIVPIALGYHFAHYLGAFLVDVQYAAVSLGDPFGRGWDLFGLAGRRVTASFLTDYHAVRAIWHCQVAIIVAAHVAAVAIGHLLALGEAARRRPAVLGQLPLTLLMVVYSQFGLWLLSSAAVG